MVCSGISYALLSRPTLHLGTLPNEREQDEVQMATNVRKMGKERYGRATRMRKGTVGDKGEGEK